MASTEVEEKKETRRQAPRGDQPGQSALRRPHNEEEERAVLGAMLLDNDIIPDIVDHLRSEDFYAPAHRLVFQAIMEIYDRGEPVELLMLMDELRKKGKLEAAGGYVTLASLEQFVVSTGHAPELARHVREKATLRKLMDASETILRDCAAESRGAMDQVSAAEKLIFDISQQSDGGEFTSIDQIIPHTIEEIGNLRASSADISGLRTHFYDLDRLLNGLHKSDLLILAARPSIGKTTFALNLLLNISWEEKVPTAIFSLEMGRESLTMRLLCSHAQVNGQKVATGHLKESEFQLLRQRASELSECPIFIDDSPGLSLMQLRSRARRLKALHPDLGFIVVDYLQLMHASDTGSVKSRQEEVSEISRGLKAMARELNVPVMALSQLSRNIEQRSGKDKNARPMLSDLRESGAIEQDADIVMFVHRERLETRRDDEGKPVHDNLPIDTEIVVGKHRNGPIGTVELLFFADYTRFMNKSRG